MLLDDVDEHAILDRVVVCRLPHFHGVSGISLEKGTVDRLADLFEVLLGDRRRLAIPEVLREALELPPKPAFDLSIKRQKLLGRAAIVNQSGRLYRLAC